MGAVDQPVVKYTTCLLVCQLQNLHVTADIKGVEEQVEINWTHKDMVAMFGEESKNMRVPMNTFARVRCRDTLSCLLICTNCRVFRAYHVTMVDVSLPAASKCLSTSCCEPLQEFCGPVVEKVSFSKEDIAYGISHDGPTADFYISGKAAEKTVKLEEEEKKQQDSEVPVGALAETVGKKGEPSQHVSLCVACM